MLHKAHVPSWWRGPGWTWPPPGWPAGWWGSGCCTGWWTSAGCMQSWWRCRLRSHTIGHLFVTCRPFFATVCVLTSAGQVPAGVLGVLSVPDGGAHGADQGHDQQDAEQDQDLHVGHPLHVRALQWRLGGVLGRRTGQWVEPDGAECNFNWNFWFAMLIFFPKSCNCLQIIMIIPLC